MLPVVASSTSSSGAAVSPGRKSEDHKDLSSAVLEARASAVLKTRSFVERVSAYLEEKKLPSGGAASSSAAGAAGASSAMNAAAPSSSAAGVSAAPPASSASPSASPTAFQRGYLRGRLLFADEKCTVEKILQSSVLEDKHTEAAANAFELPYSHETRSRIHVPVGRAAVFWGPRFRRGRGGGGGPENSSTSAGSDKGAAGVVIGAVVGPSGSGKTTALEEFRRTETTTSDEDLDRFGMAPSGLVDEEIRDGNGSVRIFPTGFRSVTDQLHIGSRPVTDHQTQLRHRSDTSCMRVYKLCTEPLCKEYVSALRL